MSLWNESLFVVIAVTAYGGLAYAYRWGSGAVIGVLAGYVVLLNLFVTKQLLLFGWHATAAEPLAVALSLGMNLLREGDDPQQARRAVAVCMLVSILSASLGWLVTLQTSADHDYGGAALQHLLIQNPRIVAASILSLGIASKLEVYTFGWLRTRWRGRALPLRHILASSFAQLVDTTLFTVGALSGWVESLWEVAAVAFTIKLFALILSSPFILCASARRHQEIQTHASV